MGSVSELCESLGGGSEASDEGAVGFVGGFPAGETAFGSDGGSDGGSLSLFGESAAAGSSGREADPAEGITSRGVGLSLPGSPGFVEAAAGSLGRDAGLAASVEGVACSGVVVGLAGVGAGVGLGPTGEVGTSNASGVNAIGGSKRANVDKVKGSLQKPVHSDAHVGSRENISIGGTISGSHGGPIVVMMSPLADVLNPKPQVGHARS